MTSCATTARHVDHQRLSVIEHRRRVGRDADDLEALLVRNAAAESPAERVLARPQLLGR